MDKKRIIKAVKKASEVISYCSTQIKGIDKGLINELNEIEKTLSKATKKPHKSCEEREKEFYDRIAIFVLKYGKKVCREFYEGWSEWNDSKTLMKWEIAKRKVGTFNIERRLATWEKKSELYTPKKINQQNGQAAEKASMPETYRPA